MQVHTKQKDGRQYHAVIKGNLEQGLTFFVLWFPFTPYLNLQTPFRKMHLNALHRNSGGIY
jgi:hypothetical protein